MMGLCTIEGRRCQGSPSRASGLAQTVVRVVREVSMEAAMEAVVGVAKARAVKAARVPQAAKTGVRCPSISSTRSAQ